MNCRVFAGAVVYVENPAWRLQPAVHLLKHVGKALIGFVLLDIGTRGINLDKGKCIKKCRISSGAYYGLFSKFLFFFEYTMNKLEESMQFFFPNSATLLK